MPEPLDVALIGFGSVARSLTDRIARLPEQEVRIVGACDTGGAVLDEDGFDPAELLEVKRASGTVARAPGRQVHASAAEVAAMAPADAIVQLTPTDLHDPTASLAAIEAAIEAGHDVVTAAKDALALAPERIRSLERRHDARVLHSAAVAGSVPLLETLQTAFAGDTVERVEGLLNGSTTYVLSRMEQGASREKALARARQAGLLEADPTLDLSGRDAGAKAALIHQTVYGSTLSLDEVDVQGLGTTDEQACRRARRTGFAIRLMARVDEAGARVRPVEVPREGPFAVEGADACVRIVLEGAGSVVLRGPGAGPSETASAVLGDVLRVQARRGPRQVKPVRA